MMNQRLLDVCRTLSSEQLQATAPGTYGSIASTLVHVANGQEGYAARFLGEERPERMAEDPFPGFDVLSERLKNGDEKLAGAAKNWNSDHTIQVSGDDPPGTWTMPASLLFLQAINHGTEHRSQIATILTQLGVEPPEMDGWTYFSDGGHLTPVEEN
jgi:uncharacterized damage-inducible protein DinB